MIKSINLYAHRCQIKTFIKYYGNILTLNTSKLTIKTQGDTSDAIDTNPDISIWNKKNKVISVYMKILIQESP